MTEVSLSLSATMLNVVFKSDPSQMHHANLRTHTGRNNVFTNLQSYLQICRKIDL